MTFDNYFFQSKNKQYVMDRTIKIAYINMFDIVPPTERVSRTQNLITNISGFGGFI